MKKTHSLLLSLALLAGGTTVAFAQPQTADLSEPGNVAPTTIESPVAPIVTAPMAEEGQVITATIEGKVVSINTEKYQVGVQVLPGGEAKTVLVGPNDIGGLKIGDTVKIQVTADNIASSVEIIKSEDTTTQ